MDSTSPNQLAFNIWKHSNWLRPEKTFIRSNYKIKHLSIIYQRYVWNKLLN